MTNDDKNNPRKPAGTGTTGEPPETADPTAKFERIDPASPEANEVEPVPCTCLPLNGPGGKVHSSDCPSNPNNLPPDTTRILGAQIVRPKALPPSGEGADGESWEAQSERRYGAEGTREGPDSEPGKSGNASVEKSTVFQSNKDDDAKGASESGKGASETKSHPGGGGSHTPPGGGRH